MVRELALRTTNTTRVREHADAVREKLMELLRISFNAINESQTTHVSNRANKELLYDLRVSMYSHHKVPVLKLFVDCSYN